MIFHSGRGQKTQKKIYVALEIERALFEIRHVIHLSQLLGKIKKWILSKKIHQYLFHLKLFEILNYTYMKLDLE